jgi:FkbM family methyltransferase
MLISLPFLIEKYNLNITGIIHIGGHTGQEIPIYEECGIKEVVFFEPQPEIFKVLEENCVNSKLITYIYNVALGNKIGMVEMFVEKANGGQSSSILKPLLHLQQYPDIIFEDKITVKINTLDSYHITKRKFNFLNIDTQGYDLEVLKGAKETLKYIDCVYCEVNRAEVYEGCPMVEDIDSYLKDYRFERVETDWSGGNWGDAFYLKY